MASSNLAIGATVVVDCVNPVRESRQGWRLTANRAGRTLIEIEVICSDLAEHRRRVETRRSDIEGLVPPTWEAVSRHEYEPWHEPRIVIDTAGVTPAEAIATAERHVNEIAAEV